MTQSSIKPQVIAITIAVSTKSKPDIKRVFRQLSDAESFYFYRAIGEPLGQKASSLHDFLNKLQTVDVLSVAFHFYRGDFECWIRNTLGDFELASQLTLTERTTLKGEPLRNYIVQRVKARFNDYNVKIT